MAVSNLPVFPQLPILGLQSYVNADSTNKKTVLTAGVNGMKVLALTATSTETASARVAAVWLVRSAVAYLLTSVNIPVNSGFDGTTPSVDLLNGTQLPGVPFDNVTQNFLVLQNGDLLQVSMTTAVTAGKEIDVVGTAINF